MRDLLIETFCRLVRTASPTGSERAVADLVAQYLADLGLSVYQDHADETSEAECGNLLALAPATAAGYPVLLLNAHLDTVVHEGGIEPVVEGDLIRSAGDTILGADDKAGVVLLLLALRRLREERLPHGDLWVVFTVAEETGLWGAQRLEYERLQPWPEMGYVLDGGRQPGKMTTAAPSSCRLDVTITGCAAHAGVCPELGASAIQAAARAIAALQLGRLDAETTANVGTIFGGSARNIVPEHCHLQAEARSYDEGKLTAQVEHMTACFREAGRAAGAQVEVTVGRDYTAFALSDDAPVVRRAAAAARRLGLEPVTERGGGGSDANVFNERGIPSLNMATGAIDVHTPQEQLDIAAALRCLEWLVGTAVISDKW
jgi:tripeptide aminopeptidase